MIPSRQNKWLHEGFGSEFSHTDCAPALAKAWLTKPSPGPPVLGFKLGSHLHRTEKPCSGGRNYSSTPTRVCHSGWDAMEEGSLLVFWSLLFWPLSLQIYHQ